MMISDDRKKIEVRFLFGNLRNSFTAFEGFDLNVLFCTNGILVSILFLHVRNVFDYLLLDD